MTSLVMCEGTDCKRKESCRRFLQTPLPKFQAYLCMPVACKDLVNCKWYVENKPLTPPI